MTFSRFAAKVDDLVNPIAIKEMRQAVNGNFITWLLIFFLAAQCVIVGFPLIFNNDTVADNFSLGRLIFNLLLLVLLMTSILFLPSYITIRFTLERTKKNIDLFFFTNMRPVSIILGKTLAAMLLTLLFFSASVPFMTFTFLLRGLDLPSIFIVLFFNFLVVIFVIQLAILTATLPGGAISRGISAFAVISLFFFLFAGALFYSHNMLESGIGSTMNSGDFWVNGIIITSFVLTIAGLLFLLSVSIITSPSSNKSFSIRLYLVLLWFISGIITHLYSSIYSKDYFTIWITIMTLLFCISMIIATSERQELGPRIRKKIPEKLYLRVPAFLLFSGSAGGIAFAAVMVCLTLFGGYMISNIRFSSNSILISANIGTITFCSCLTASFIGRFFLKNIKRPYVIACIALGIVAVVVFIPAFIKIMESANPKYGIMLSNRQIAETLMLVWKRKLKPEMIISIGTWAVFAITINVPWFLNKIRGFKPGSDE